MNHFIVDGRYRDILQEHGIDVRKVLKKAALPDDIFHQKTVTMKEEDYYCFLDTMASVSEKGDLAVLLSVSDRIESFSPPIFAAYCSRNGKVLNYRGLS